ncbi:MAG: hypothetical protein AAGB11_12155 [Pseudomonadota bacterium]
MPTFALVIWAVSLIIVAVIIVPVAVGLLRRTIVAAWAIERYLKDMELAGAKIAVHTGAIPALDDTLAVAGTMVGVANDIEEKTEVAKTVLAARAQEAVR